MILVVYLGHGICYYSYSKEAIPVTPYDGHAQPALL